MKPTRSYRATSASSRASGRPWRLFSFALIAASALFLASCKSVKSVTASRSTSSDSLSLNIVQGVRVSSQAGVPAVDAASVTLPLQDLTQLPEGASYTGRQGTARVTATRKGGSLVVEGESLNTGGSSLTVETTQEGRSTGRSESESEATRTQHVQQPEGHWPRDALAAVVILAGIAAMLLWLNKRQ